MTRRIFISGALSTLLLSNVKAMTVFDPSNFAQNLFQVLNQAKDFAEQARHYQELAQQLQQQIQMVKMQIQNLKSLSSYDFRNLGILMYKIRNVFSGVEAISYDMGNVSKIFEEQYKDFDGYYDDIKNAGDEENRNKTFSDRYKKITKTNQNTLKGTLQKLELAEKDFETEETIVTKLKQRSATAQGNLEVLQAGNDLLAYQIDELRRLRTMLMTQTNALTNYYAAKNNEMILNNAKKENFYNSNKNDFKQSNPDVLKW